MANIRHLQRSFGGGEVTPEFFGRIDDVKYQTGLATCRNFVTKPHGPAENRAGLAFVREVKDSTKKVRLLPFTFSTTQTMVIEMGAGYFRFHTMGGTLMSGGVPYEVANPYTEADLFDVHYVQSADVMTLVHPSHAPRELRRLGATNWQLQQISFAPPIATPTNLTISETGATTHRYWYAYAVTAVKEDVNGTHESTRSTAIGISSNLYETGARVDLGWDAVPGADYYIVYKREGGLYGYIGQTDMVSFRDENLSPDMSKTPPIYDSNLFSGAGNRPGAVSYFEQRRFFAGTLNNPQNIWGTRSGTESNMSFSQPTRADDRIAFRVAAREANTIRHIVPLAEMVLLTSSAEWVVDTVNSDALTPATISVRPQSYVGASNVQPVVINNSLLYGAARGGHVREMGYNWQAGGFVTGDLSLRAPHLFDNLDIVDMAYSKAPMPVVWFVSSNGRLLGLTYVPEQQVGAWHWHDTDGTFESIAVVAEGHEDVVYAVVRRTINGVQRRYVERMRTRQFVDPADAFFVDCGATYSGAAATAISGLSHLEGKEVNILADGAVHPKRTVVGGQIELDHPASKVQVGLPIYADLETLPVALGLQDGSFGQGRYKNVNKAWLRVHRSSGIFVGPNAERLVEVKQRTTESYGQPPALKSEEIEIMVRPDWGDSGQVFIRQHDPLPLTAVNLTLEVALGG